VLQLAAQEARGWVVAGADGDGRDRGASGSCSLLAGARTAEPAANPKDSPSNESACMFSAGLLLCLKLGAELRVGLLLRRLTRLLTLVQGPQVSARVMHVAMSAARTS